LRSILKHRYLVYGVVYLIIDKFRGFFFARLIRNRDTITLAVVHFTDLIFSVWAFSDVHALKIQLNNSHNENDNRNRDKIYSKR
jgi:hypothetical protein